jgi:hypothetical protein
MLVEEAAGRLIALAEANAGTVTAAQVEADPALQEDRDSVSAAAHMLAGGTNVFSYDESDDREWFPYSGLIFSDLQRRHASR